MQVAVITDLQQGATSYDISVEVLPTLAVNTNIIKVKLNSYGHITSNEDEILIQSLKWSDDVHSSNLILERGSSEQSVRLRTIKAIKKGEQLTMWFTQDLLAAMDIPFLNPINIRGEKNYTCHRCGQIFEVPNPLKVHLGLNCGALKIKDLWKRLKTSLSISSVEPQSQRPEFMFKLSLKRRKPITPINETQQVNYIKPSSPVFSSYSNPSPDRCNSHSEETRPSSEPPRNSAFKPYLNSPASDQRNELNLYESQPKIKEIMQRIPVPEYLNKEHYFNQHASEIETLVSNLGQSKEGHLCLYCGKIYSRKYGLKIHIRTHTGFKPLKCKYCLRPFGDPSNLNKHVRLHAETETPYRCHLCNKMLVRRRDLERHMKSRHDIEDI